MDPSFSSAISAHGAKIPRKKYNCRRLPSAVDRAQSPRRPVRQSFKERLGLGDEAALLYVMWSWHLRLTLIVN